MIQFKEVSFAYEDGTEVLKNISFQIREGERVGLIGANGAGKSTLMKSSLGLLQAEGEIRICGNEMIKKNLAAIRRDIGYVLQDSDSQMFMPTVFEDMLFGPMNYGMKRDEAEKKIDEILTNMNLMHLKHKHNHRMSGGEKRMAAIATILAMEPKILMMDEPSSSLDPKNRRILIHTLNQLPHTKLIASHDLDMILDTCDRVLLQSDGKIIADGPAKDILSDEQLLLENSLELPFYIAGQKSRM